MGVRTPSYQAGFYAPERGGRAAYPGLWRGCVGAWNPGLGQSGLVLRDWGGRKNHGTLTNGPVWSTSTGRQALSFDGVNDYVGIGDVASLKITGAITLSVWVKRGAILGTLQGVLSKGGGGGGAGYAPYTLVWNHDNGMYFLQSTTGDDWHTLILSSTKITDTNWHHIVATNNLTTARLYIDNVAENTDTNPALLLWDNTRPVLIGAEHDGSILRRFNNGFIDDVRIYNRALSTSEIKLLFQHPGIAYELAPRKFYSLPLPPSSARLRRLLTGAT